MEPELTGDGPARGPAADSRPPAGGPMGRRACPLGLPGMLAVVAATEVHVARRPDEYGTSQAILWAAPVGHFPAVDRNDPTIFPMAWECDPLSEYYIHKFLDLAGSRGIPAFWLVTPVAPEVQAHRDELAMEEPYTRFIDGIVARHAGVVVVDGRRSHYGAEAFVDTIHLNRDGAVALTDDLAEIIRPRIGPREGAESCWVSLPEYRPDPQASRIEDAVGSSLAVENLRSLGVLR